MCGRMTLHDIEQMKTYLEMHFDIHEVDLSDLPRYNIAPKQKLWTLIYDGTKFRLGQLQWGIQLNSKNQSYFNINARIESVLKYPQYKPLLNHKRALVLLDGYYEWQDQGDFKQPFYIHEPSHKIMVIPALYQKEANGYGVTLITKEASDDIKHIHERMPYLLNPYEAIEYLKKGTFPKEHHLSLHYYEVSHNINFVKLDSPQLLAPLQTWIDG
jgi:putative SOS response-associated peptidase YedK